MSRTLWVMNKAVQILLVFSFIFPVLGAAQEETLEERKQRIVRKYLRENRAITQSDMIVPSDQPEEDERVAESETFEQVGDMFEREEGGARPMPPQQQARRIPLPQQPSQANWLLEEENNTQDDLYADPYALDQPKDATQRDDYWSKWRERDGITSGNDSDNRYGRESYNPYSSRERSAGQDRYRTGQSPYGSYGIEEKETPTRYGFDASPLYGNRDGVNNRNGRTETSGSSGFRLQEPQTTYGSSLDSGLLSSPYPNSGTTTREEGRYSRPGYGTGRSQGNYAVPTYQPKAYQPRPSPWRTGSGSGTQQPSQSEYQKNDLFQQYKEKNKSWDPSKSSDLLDEIRRQNQR